MSRPTRQLARDEVRLGNNEIASIVAGDTWIEFESSVGSDGGNTITARYEIRDIVTDAISVVLLDQEPFGEEQEPTADYEMNQFRDNAESGHLYPATVLSNSDTLPDPPGHEDDEKVPDGQEIVRMMGEATNTSNVNPESIMDEFDEQHNFLQSQIFDTVVKPLIIAAATTPQCDKRNRETRKEAQQIVQEFDWDIPDTR